MAKQTYDVIIIGAGAAGLKAAKTLIKKGKSVCVLEARNRVGGRIKPATIANHTVDIGAGWVNNEQELVLEEASEYGLSVERQYAKGNSILDLNNTINLFNSEQFGLSFFANWSLNKAMKKLEHHAITVDVHKPWTCDHAREWDSQTLQNWIDQNVKNPEARAYFETSVTIELAIEPSKISYLYFLQLVRADQILEKEPAGVEGAWSFVVKGGLYQIIANMAEQMKDCIHLNQAVRAVKQSGQSVEVHTQDKTYQAQFCIVAIPPTFTTGIQFEPSFSSRRTTLMQSMPMGAAVKSFIAYEQPFWRKNDHSGIIISNATPFAITLDVSPFDESIGILTAVACGNKAIDLSALDQNVREKILIKQLKHYYGELANKPLAYIDNDWAKEPWSLCGYSGYLPPGMLTMVKGELSLPSGRIHWAGTETATQWHGAIEGALLSGVRSANEILEKLV